MIHHLVVGGLSSEASQGSASKEGERDGYWEGNNRLCSLLPGEGFRVPGARVTGHCVRPGLGLGTKLRSSGSSASAEPSLNVQGCVCSHLALDCQRD